MTKRNNYLVKKYGITEEQFEELLRKQEGCCAVCKRQASEFKSRLCVDHDHHETSRKIRGLLCNYCNRRIIGRHRTPRGEELFLSAAKYLAGPYPGYVVPVKKKKRKKRNVIRRHRLKK